MEMDVTDPGRVQAVIDAVVQSCGRIDILVNNAGVNTLAHRVPIDQFPREEWDRILGVDLTGLYLVSKAVVPVMRSQASGRIINIASVAGLIPLRLQSAFVAAKAAVVNLTKSMAIELGEDGILTNAVRQTERCFPDHGESSGPCSRVRRHHCPKVVTPGPVPRVRLRRVCPLQRRPPCKGRFINHCLLP